MKIDAEVLIEKLMVASEDHAAMVPSPWENKMVPGPNFDLTAANVLRGIAFAISEATASSERSEK